MEELEQKLAEKRHEKNNRERYYNKHGRVSRGIWQRLNALTLLVDRKRKDEFKHKFTYNDHD